MRWRIAIIRLYGFNVAIFADRLEISLAGFLNTMTIDSLSQKCNGL